MIIDQIKSIWNVPVCDVEGCYHKKNLATKQHIIFPICSRINSSVSTLFQKLKGGAGSKRYGMDFSRSHEGKEENPRNYNGLRSRERKNTFHLTLNQRQLLSFETV
jgi:hypothetical protein